MSKPISSTEHNYRYGSGFRYVAMHFGPTRAQRRSTASRHVKTKKMCTPESVNVPYLTPPPPTSEESTDA